MQEVQLSAHFMHEGATHEYPLWHEVHVSIAPSHKLQLAGEQASHTLVVPVELYLNPSLQNVHSVLLAQIAQLVMQASQVFGVAVFKFHPSLHKVQIVLLA